MRQCAVWETNPPPKVQVTAPVPHLIDSIGRGGAIRTPDPLRPRDRNRLQGLHRFSPNPNIYNNLGNLLFARQPTQVASRDDVQTQF